MSVLILSIEKIKKDICGYPAENIKKYKNNKDGDGNVATSNWEF